MARLWNLSWCGAWGLNVGLSDSHPPLVFWVIRGLISFMFHVTGNRRKPWQLQILDRESKFLILDIFGVYTIYSKPQFWPSGSLSRNSGGFELKHRFLEFGVVGVEATGFVLGFSVFLLGFVFQIGS